MEIQIKSFQSLSAEELYEALQLRAGVFVLEQQCLYQDIDGRDFEAWHVFGRKEGKMVAYARYFEPKINYKEAVIGRVLVHKSERGKGYGHAILESIVEVLSKKHPSNPICLSAQQYLIGFYESHGFWSKGNGYLEDGIPHILMVKKK